MNLSFVRLSIQEGENISHEAFMRNECRTRMIAPMIGSCESLQVHLRLELLRSCNDLIQEVKNRGEILLHEFPHDLRRAVVKYFLVLEYSHILQNNQGKIALFLVNLAKGYYLPD
jgi:hypothetical protein